MALLEASVSLRSTVERVFDFLTSTENFTKIVPPEGNDQRPNAIAVLAMLIGALTLSRACVGVDNNLADEVLTAVREQLVGPSP